MTDTLTAAEPAASEPRDDASFTTFEDALNAAGPAAALDRLIDQLDAAHEYRALLDALLLKARFELGLPMIMPGSLSRPSRAGTHAVRRRDTSAPSAWSGRGTSTPATFRRPGPIIARSPKPSRSRTPFATTSHQKTTSDWARSSRSPSITASVSNAGSS